MAEKAKKKAAARPAAERAQQALDVANRLVSTTQGRLDKAKAAVVELESELTKATARRDYAALNPDLPQSEGNAIPEGRVPTPDQAVAAAKAE